MGNVFLITRGNSKIISKYSNLLIKDIQVFVYIIGSVIVFNMACGANGTQY